jgi:osmotically-inducible protein OsmY
MHAEQITPITPITPITSIGQRPLVKVLTALAAWIAAVLLVAATFAAGPGQVQDSTEATPADAAITQRVENALAKDPFLRSQEIYVETQDGVVNLTGFVRSLDGIARAEELARGVRGVSAVRNGLRVANRPSQA